MDVREKLIELLNEVQETGVNEIPAGFGYTSEYVENEKVSSHLIANGVTVQEWISVKDRLPEQGERVLATDGGFVGELYVNSRCQWQRYNVNDHSLMMALDILWWMPLPEPPKGE